MIKAVLFSSGLIHPSLYARITLTSLVKNLPNIHLTTRSTLDSSASPECTDADIWIFHFHNNHITSNHIQNIRSYLAKHGRILAIHSASASFKTSAEYEQFLGGKFVSHGSITDFTICPAPEKEDVFMVDQPFSIRDELYFHQYDSSCCIQYQTVINGKTEPIAWTKEHHPGRIAYFSPGHRAITFQNPFVKTIISDLINWLLKNPV